MQGWSLKRLPTMVCSCTDENTRSALLASLSLLIKEVCPSKVLQDHVEWVRQSKLHRLLGSISGSIRVVRLQLLPRGLVHSFILEVLVSPGWKVQAESQCTQHTAWQAQTLKKLMPRICVRQPPSDCRWTAFRRRSRFGRQNRLVIVCMPRSQAQYWDSYYLVEALLQSCSAAKIAAQKTNSRNTHTYIYSIIYMH